MNGCDLATVYEPLKRSWMDLEHGRRLMTVEQWLAVDSGASICSYALRWSFLVGHNDSLLYANAALALVQARFALRVSIVQ
jgi:hypothetical protein